MKQTKINGCGKVVEFKNYSKKCGFSYDEGVFFCKKCKKGDKIKIVKGKDIGKVKRWNKLKTEA